MKRIALALLIAAMAVPSWADSYGSATGGTAATQSNAAGCMNQTPTLSAGQQATVRCDANGNLSVTISNPPGSEICSFYLFEGMGVFGQIRHRRQSGQGHCVGD